MDNKKNEDERVDVNFESHPPIEDDLDGIAKLLRQTLLQFADCNSLAKYLIELKDVTQVIALEAPDEENTSDEEEPDDNIFGVISMIDLQAKLTDDSQKEALKQLVKFLKDKNPELKRLFDTDDEKAVKICLVINERYINLPPQLSLPTFKNLNIHLDKSHYTHLVFVAKLQLKSRSAETKLPSKKAKTGASSSQDAEPIIFVNAEEEIIFEHCDNHVDIDVSSFCDENASWSFNSDVKYVPHRRIMVVERKKWTDVMRDLEKELN